MYFNHMDCCGVKEIAGIRYNYRHTRPLAKLKDLWARCEREKWRFAFLIFTDHRNVRHGTAFADFIRAHELGELVETSKKRNTNSGNMVKVWVWGVNKRKFKAFARQEGWYEEIKKQQAEWEKRRQSGQTMYSWNAPPLLRLFTGLD